MNQCQSLILINIDTVVAEYEKYVPSKFQRINVESLNISLFRDIVSD